MDESLKRDQEQDAALAASEGKQPNTEQSEGVGTPPGGTDVDPGGLTGGYGTGGVPPEEQADEGKA